MKKRTLIVLGLTVLLVLLRAVTLTQAHGLSPVPAGGGGYEIAWSTIDGGGAMFSMGGGYSLGGTIGQADAGAMSSGNYVLIGGLWGASAQYRVYLPLIIK